MTPAGARAQAAVRAGVREVRLLTLADEHAGRAISHWDHLLVRRRPDGQV
ncbi:hypothetical protein [Nonomuraea sp. NPDC049709]